MILRKTSIIGFYLLSSQLVFNPHREAKLNYAWSQDQHYNAEALEEASRYLLLAFFSVSIFVGCETIAYMTDGAFYVKKVKMN